MTPDQFQRSVSHGYSAEFHVIGWVAGGLGELVMQLLIVMAGGALLAVLVLAAPTVVLLRYRDRITARFCPQYRRPERDRRE
jgi:hypothetical protein